LLTNFLSLPLSSCLILSFSLISSSLSHFHFYPFSFHSACQSLLSKSVGSFWTSASILFLFTMTVTSISVSPIPAVLFSLCTAVCLSFS
jgi:hypothetical protein